MDVFVRFVAAVGKLPDWLSLFFSPACALVLFAWFCRKGRFELFRKSCLVLAALGFVLLCCEGEPRYACVWLGLFALFCAGLRAIPSLFAFARRKRKKREERIYEAFRTPPEEAREERRRPPKVDCFGEAPEGEETADDLGELRLSHVQDLLARLRSAPLTAGDRLETDVLARSLDVYRKKNLTADEVRSLNDCLATVLKLTAKYSL